VHNEQATNDAGRSGIADLKAKLKSAQYGQQEQQVERGEALQRGALQAEITQPALKADPDMNQQGNGTNGRTTEIANGRADDETTTSANRSGADVEERQLTVSVMPTISAEQQEVFQKEPELFHVYASASSDSESEHDQQEKRNTKRGRAADYSASPQPGRPTSSELESDASDRDTSAVSATIKPTGSIAIDKPKIISDVVIPASQQISNGRFACPFKDLHSCDRTFADSKGAKRHATVHVDVDRYKCHICDKGLTREDTYQKHLKGHEKGTIRPGKKAEPAELSDTNAQLDVTTNEGILPATSNAVLHALDDTTVPQNTLEDGVLKQDVPKEPEAEDEDVDMHDVAVTDAEEETESDESDGEDETPNDKVVEDIVQSDSEGLTESDGDEEKVASAADSMSSPSPTESSSVVPATPPVTAGLKRKRESLSSRSPLRNSPKARKRLRQEAPSQSPIPVPVKETVVDEADETDLEEKDVESDSASSASVSHIAESDDVDMELADKVTKPSSVDDTEPSSEEEDGNVETPAVRHQMSSSEEEDQERKRSPVKAKVKRQSSGSAATAKPVKVIIPRNGTLDDYVERSKTRSESADSVPRQNTKSGKLRAKNDKRPRRVRSKKSPSAADESENENSEVEDGVEHKTSSEDRPKATTVARRTSSTRTKKQQDVRRVSKKPLQSTEIASTDDDDDQNEDRASGETSHEDQQDSNSDLEDQPKPEKQSKKQLKRVSEAGSRAKGSRSAATGRFTDEEIAVLHAWRDGFCELHQMSHHEFNEMMTATISKDTKGFRAYEKFMSKRDFLNEYYEQLPNRNRRAMTRFRERHFQNVEKSGWASDDDDELERLVKELGNKWVEIGQLMGRTQDSVHQRWRHKLNYGVQRAAGDWTPDELDKLEQEVLAMAEKQGKDPDDSDLEIKWSVVSERLGTGRTAQQCSNRWRINTHTRKGTKFVRVPHADRIPSVKKGPRTPSKMEKRLTPKKASAKKTTNGAAEQTPGKKKFTQRGNFKSEEYVKDSDDESGEDEVGDKTEHEKSGSEDHEDTPHNSHSSTESSSSPTNDEDVSDEEHATYDDEPGDEQSSEEDEATAMIKEKMGNGTDDDESEDDTDASKLVPEARVSGTSSLPQSSSRKPDRLSKTTRQQSSQVPSSSQATKTPAISKNPFNTKTPANAPSMSQLYNGTQATSNARPTTGKMSRVPETEERPERPSPTISMRHRPISSPLDLLAQVAVDQEHDVDETDAEDDRSADENTKTTLKSPNSFVSAKSERSEESEEGDNEESSSESDGSGTSSGTEESSTEGSEDGDEDEDETVENEAVGHKQEHRQAASQPSIWQSVNNLTSKLTSFSQPAPSKAAQPGKKRRTLVDALRGVPADDSSDDE